MGIKDERERENYEEREGGFDRIIQSVGGSKDAWGVLTNASLSFTFSL